MRQPDEPSHRNRGRPSVLVSLGAGAAAAAVVIAWAVVAMGGHSAAAPGRPAIVVRSAAAQQPAGAAGASPAASRRVSCSGNKVGVATNNLTAFEKAVRVRPAVSAKYLRWGLPFPAQIVAAQKRLHVATQIVLEPHGVSLRQIVEGREDRWIARWAAAERRADAKIILSFAPEANGKWYSWGLGHDSPALYRAAWHHLYRVLRAHRVRRLSWMWQVNVVFKGTAPLRGLWPGSSYVTTVGIDGHLHEGQTFKGVFWPTIRDVRKITSKPVVIAELAVNRSRDRVRQINEMFSALCKDRLQRFVWFDLNAKGDDMMLEGDPAAIAAFRRDAARLH